MLRSTSVTRIRAWLSPRTVASPAKPIPTTMTRGPVGGGRRIFRHNLAISSAYPLRPALMRPGSPRPGGRQPPRMRVPVAMLPGSAASRQNILAVPASAPARLMLMTPDVAQLPDGFELTVSLSRILTLVTCVTVTVAEHGIVGIENVPLVAPSGSTRVAGHCVITPFFCRASPLQVPANRAGIASAGVCAETDGERPCLAAPAVPGPPDGCGGGVASGDGLAISRGMSRPPITHSTASPAIAAAHPAAARPRRPSRGAGIASVAGAYAYGPGACAYAPGACAYGPGACAYGPGISAYVPASCAYGSGPGGYWSVTGTVCNGACKNTGGCVARSSCCEYCISRMSRSTAVGRAPGSCTTQSATMPRRCPESTPRSGSPLVSW